VADVGTLALLRLAAPVAVLPSLLANKLISVMFNILFNRR